LDKDILRLLLFNLRTDSDDPVLGFTTIWLRALAARVASIDVITMYAGRLDLPDNVLVYSVGKEMGHSEPRRVLAFYRHLSRILARNPPDACFSHMIPIFTVLAAPLLRARHIPIVTWYAHPHPTITLKLAHHLSDWMATSLSTSYPYRRDAKVVPIGQGIDTDLFIPGQESPQSPPMILCVGRISPVKNLVTLVKASRQLREKWQQPFEVVVLGSPLSEIDRGYLRTLREMAARLEVQDIVRFESAIPMAEVPSWYRRCTIHVNLTATGSGDKVAWEAMSCGRPCLVTNQGFAETLGEQRDRLLFRLNDSTDLAERMRSLLELPDRDRAEVGRYLREQVIEQHSINRLAHNLLHLLSSQARDGEA
jgi:glycosyltransferase involved in cell wall biosynthesis